MVKTIVFNIKGMHCSSCAIDIDGVLEDTDGVLSSGTSYAKAQTKVEFDITKISEQQVIKLIKQAGYQVE